MKIEVQTWDRKSKAPGESVALLSEDVSRVIPHTFQSSDRGGVRHGCKIYLKEGEPIDCAESVEEVQSRVGTRDTNAVPQEDKISDLAGDVPEQEVLWKS